MMNSIMMLRRMSRCLGKDADRLLAQWEKLGESPDTEDCASRWALGAQAASLISFKSVIDDTLKGAK